MSVAYVTLTRCPGSSGGWTTGTSVTPGAGSDRALIVGINMYPGNVSGISSVTFKGTNLTKLRSDTILGEARTEIWYGTEATLDLSSAGTLVITPTSGTPTTEEVAFAATFSGVHQTVPEWLQAGIAVATGTGGTEGTSIGSDANGMIFATITTFSTTDITATSPGTERDEFQNTSNLMDSECQTSPGTGGSVTVAWAGMNNASDRAASIMSIAPAVAGASLPPVAPRIPMALLTR